jgi:hypothetical protein
VSAGILKIPDQCGRSKHCRIAFQSGGQEFYLIPKYWEEVFFKGFPGWIEYQLACRGEAAE